MTTHPSGRLMRRPILTAAGLAAGLLLGVVPLAIARGSLFDEVSGSWSGGGTVVVAGGSPEPIRCRASYASADGSQLRIALRCASDSFNIQVSSDIVRDGERISGSWSEAGSGVTGDVVGSVGPAQLRADVSGMGVTARLTLALRGNTQAVTLSSNGAISASASVTLRRS